LIELHNIDCLEAMRGMPDKAFDLAIVDPPYGAGKIENCMIQQVRRPYKNEKPGKEYFDLLMRVSKNQIIWGGNYFDLGPCRGFIFWFKHQPIDRFADGEFAWTSFDRVAKCFNYPYTNVMEGNGGKDYKTIHPNQKPVKLYEWLLKNYAKPGDRILDTHGGSFSLAIACDTMGYDFTGYEIDAEYYEAAKKRLEEHKRQGRLFDAVSV
jgi:site-specific DNA-methyltransferase (adenine-specific)